ncbi:hypothetical protein FRC11_000893, partial [Ceratobasidium sp. 423]
MERLSESGFPMSQIDVQRRMRPEVSTLIRKSLYPNLKDNDLVTQYPNVRGMYKDVFFISHTNKEAGGGEDSVSKHNAHEVEMIYQLVLHLLRQGCYNKEGNIVVLAAYLGQIPKIRQKLRDVVTTIVDERDAELLERHGIEDEETTTVQEVKVSKHVLIRTLDNFQGEEGEVIILSLVRNSGTPYDGLVSSLQYTGDKSPIGFLRSENRTNVGLSRAKHGMYILGNAPELAKGSKMWATVLQELHQSKSIGTKLPITCQRHPDYVEWVDQPNRLPIVSPDGAETRASACVPSTIHAIASAGNVQSLSETAASQSEMSSFLVAIFILLLHVTLLACRRRLNALPRSRNHYRSASTMQRCPAAKIQPRIRVKNPAESILRVAPNLALPSVGLVRNLALRPTPDDPKLGISHVLSTQSISAAAFYVVGTHAKTNARKVMLARVHARTHVVKYVLTAVVVSHARRLAIHACSHVLGVARTFSVHLLVE